MKEDLLFWPQGSGTDMQLYTPLKIMEVLQLTLKLGTPGFNWLVHLNFIHTTSTSQENLGKSNLSQEF